MVLDSDDGCWLDAFNRRHEIARWRVAVGIWFLEVDEVRACRLQQAIDVEHIDSRSSLFECQPFLNHCRAQKVGEAYTGRARAEEEVLFIAQLGTLQFGGVDHAGKYDSRRALERRRCRRSTCRGIAEAGEQRLCRSSPQSECSTSGAIRN